MMGVYRLPPASVRVRLTLWYTLMLAVTVVGLGAALYFLLARTLTSEAEQDVSATTLAVSQAVSTSLDEQTGEVALHLPELSVLGDADTVVQVVDLRTGEVLARSANLGLRSLPQPLPPFPTATRSGGTFQTYSAEGGRFRLFSRPVFATNGELVAMVQAAHSLTTSDRLFERLRILLAIVAGLGVPATAVVGWLLAGRALAPLAQANIRLADANTRLERSLAVQQRFVADASHELRTPLTTIRANADVLRWTIGEDDADQARALTDIAGEAERLSRLLAGLLSLARADAGQGVPLERTPLKPLVDEAYRHAQMLATGQQVDVALGEDIDVQANADALRQLLLILVDNALKYTPAGGRVSLAVARDNDEARLTVTDTGVGIARSDAGHIFERFYRADTAREIDGSGLGLAIARSIVEQHAGRLEVSSRPGQGSTFTVTLKAIPSRPLTTPARSNGTG